MSEDGVGAYSPALYGDTLHSVYRYLLDRACAFLRWLGSIIRLSPPSRHLDASISPAFAAIQSSASLTPAPQLPLLLRACTLTHIIQYANFCTDFKASCGEPGRCSKVELRVAGFDPVSAASVGAPAPIRARAQEGSGGRWVGGFGAAEGRADVYRASVPERLIPRALGLTHCIHPLVLLTAFCSPLVGAVTSISASAVVFRLAAPQPGSFGTPRSVVISHCTLREDPRSALPPRKRREEDLDGAPRAQLAGGWED
ncbi:hypothetical protein DFH09DRAFT_1378048 [Mycena vulgaris]|nr:hypothetical protein DFH09DRAFT_1378048 [Mycena vulgaris]